MNGYMIRRDGGRDGGREDDREGHQRALAACLGRVHGPL